MATFRIKAEFDLVVLDDLSAKEVARQFLVERIDDATMKGQQIRTETATPADAFDDVLNSPQAFASLVATSMLARGAAATPSVKCSNLNVEHVDP